MHRRFSSPLILIALAVGVEMAAAGSAASVLPLPGAGEAAGLPLWTGYLAGGFAGGTALLLAASLLLRAQVKARTAELCARNLQLEREIAERGVAQEALRASEERFRTIFETTAAGMAIVSPFGRYLQVNPAFCRFLGYTEAELLDRSVPDITHPDDLAMTAQALDAARARIEPSVVREKRYLRKDGRTVWVHVSATWFYDPGGTPLYSVAVMQDITESKVAEEALLTSERRYRSFYLNTPVMLQTEDEEGYLVTVSEFWLESLGYGSTEVLGRRSIDFLSEESQEHWTQIVRPQFLHTGAVRDFPLQFRKKGGECMDVLFSAIAERGEAGEITHSLAVLTDITRRKQAEAKVQQLAYYDMLTGLPNRTLLRDRMTQAIAHARRDGKQVAVLALDLDRFKGINDTLGHACGDRLLQIMAERLKGCLRRTDSVARLGGDEFAVILTGIGQVEDVTILVRKIQEGVARPIHLDGQEIYCTVSIGITLYPLDGTNADSLLRHADTAMYVAKEQGRNTYQYFSREMNFRAVERLELETSLRHALERGEFFLHFQPQVDLAAGKVVGVEALLRWQHPEKGTIPPARFIPLAEETGLINPIGEWVLRRACAQAQAWRKEGLPPLRMAVNLSGRQFLQAGLVDQVRAALADSGFDPGLLELELTESILMDNADRVQRALRELKTLGVLIALDDFGTGYSSLAYLKNFPVDRLKIAGAFVRDLTLDSGDAAIAEAIIAMGHSLRLKVIAEGVETREQLDFLKTRRCNEMQGYFFARPMPAEELGAFLRTEILGVHVPKSEVPGSRFQVPG